MWFNKKTSDMQFADIRNPDLNARESREYLHLNCVESISYFRVRIITSQQPYQGYTLLSHDMNFPKRLT